MSINDTLKSIHRLAAQVEAPSEPHGLGIVLRPDPSTQNVEGMWIAQPYWGKGQWGTSGFGPTPEAAVDNLHAALLRAHLRTDERREQALKAAQAVSPTPK